jgi:hypothetical protein
MTGEDGLTSQSPHQEADEMFNMKIRTTIITLIAACSFVTATAAPAVSQADPAEGQGTPVTCSYNGGTYGVGDRISVISGAHYDNYYCGSDGEWHKVEQSVTRKNIPLPITKAASAIAVR